EIDAPKFAAVSSRPASVIPRTNHEKILFRTVVTFEQLVDLERPVKILLVPPTGNVQDRHGHAVEPWRKSLALPKRAVVRLAYKVVPRRQLAFEILRVRIREGTKVQIPVIRVEPIDHSR